MGTLCTECCAIQELCPFVRQRGVYPGYLTLGLGGCGNGGGCLLLQHHLARPQLLLSHLALHCSHTHGQRVKAAGPSSSSLTLTSPHTSPLVGEVAGCSAYKRKLQPTAVLALSTQHSWNGQRVVGTGSSTIDTIHSDGVPPH